MATRWFQPWLFILTAIVLGAACDDADDDAVDDDADDDAVDDDADDDDDDAVDDDADDDDDDDSSASSCPASEIGALLGRDALMIGGSMDDAAFESAPFDLGYRYVAGDVPEDGPCERCDVGCSVDGVSCANAVGCPWWGCWQWDQDPPGRYVADYMAYADGLGAVPMITYYIWFSVAGQVEGQPEVDALQDGARVGSYLEDFRFLCQVMAEQPSITAIVHVEPDLWGYGQQVDADPATIPVALSSAGASECAGLDDSLAGLARCLLAIARTHAPNVLVGFHASAWGAGHDALINGDPGFDLAGHAGATAAYMLALGAGDGDLVVVEMSDRDAGYNGRWWDDTDAALPSFEQAISWVGMVGDAMDLAPLWWQVPYGHMGLDDSWEHYTDNRVDYVFDHPERFADGGALGVAFGAGATGMTTPATDGGHFVERATAYFGDDPPPLCGGQR